MADISDVVYEMKRKEKIRMKDRERAKAKEAKKNVHTGSASSKFNNGNGRPLGASEKRPHTGNKVQLSDGASVSYRDGRDYVRFQTYVEDDGAPFVVFLKPEQKMLYQFHPCNPIALEEAGFNFVANVINEIGSMTDVDAQSAFAMNAIGNRISVLDAILGEGIAITILATVAMTLQQVPNGDLSLFKCFMHYNEMNGDNCTCRFAKCAELLSWVWLQEYPIFPISMFNHRCLLRSALVIFGLPMYYSYPETMNLEKNTRSVDVGKACKVIATVLAHASSDKSILAEDFDVKIRSKTYTGGKNARMIVAINTNHDNFNVNVMIMNINVNYFYQLVTFGILGFDLRSEDYKIQFDGVQFGFNGSPNIPHNKTIILECAACNDMHCSIDVRVSGSVNIKHDEYGKRVLQLQNRIIRNIFSRVLGKDLSSKVTDRITGELRTRIDVTEDTLTGEEFISRFKLAYNSEQGVYESDIRSAVFDACQIDTIAPGRPLLLDDCDVHIQAVIRIKKTDVNNETKLDYVLVLPKTSVRCVYAEILKLQDKSVLCTESVCM